MIEVAIPTSFLNILSKITGKDNIQRETLIPIYKRGTKITWGEWTALCPSVSKCWNPWTKESLVRNLVTYNVTYKKNMQFSFLLNIARYYSNLTQSWYIATNVNDTIGSPVQIRKHTELFDELLNKNSLTKQDIYILIVHYYNYCNKHVNYNYFEVFFQQQYY